MVCDDKWHSVVRVLFFILDEVFSVNTTCFVKTMINARVVVTPLFQMTSQFPKPFFGDLFAVIYPTSFVSTGQPYKNTQNCVKSSKNHPFWPSGNPNV
jgi:hypothetical protein